MPFKVSSNSTFHFINCYTIILVINTLVLISSFMNHTGNHTVIKNWNYSFPETTFTSQKVKYSLQVDYKSVLYPHLESEYVTFTIPGLKPVFFMVTDQSSFKRSEVANVVCTSQLEPWLHCRSSAGGTCQWTPRANQSCWRSVGSSQSLHPLSPTGPTISGCSPEAWDS